MSRPPAKEEGCPTPLAWQDVLSTFRQERTLHSIECCGTRLTAAKLGTGRPLYLLPGFLGDHELFVLTAWLLREECCCVMVDQPSFPAESRSSAHETLETWGRALLQLADELGHQEFHLHSTSFGGLIGLQTMLHTPERVHSASLQCGFSRWMPTVAERVIGALGRHSQRTVGTVAAVQRVQEQNHRHWFPPFDPTRWRFYRDNIASTPIAAASRRAQLAAAVDFSSELTRIDRPVLIVRSEGDGHLASQAQRELLASLPHARNADLDNCGRLPHITHPHRLVKQLRAFWDETA